MKNNLKKAKQLFRRGQYNKVLRLLEPRIFDYSESITFFYLLGYSCLYSMDFHGADSYLTKLLRLDNDNIKGLLGSACIHVKREELKEAAAIYLRILDKHPNSKEAKRGLAYIKSSRDKDRLLTFFDNGKFKRLLPGDSRKRSAAIPVLQVLAAAAIISIFLVTLSVRLELFKSKPKRPELKDISISEIDTYRTDEESAILLSEEQIKDSLRKAFTLIDGFRDNAAQVEINRLLLSNASADVKAKAEILAGILQKPKFTTLKDNFSYFEVQNFPELFEGCYVRWSGRAANISITEERISFDFLVGYEEGDVLEGIIPVYLDFAASVYQNMPLEVLGRVTLIDDGSFLLQGVGIHRLIQLE